MNEPKLFGQPELTEAEEDEALMAFNSANDVSGRWRKKKIGAFAESLHRENPLEVVWDDTTLFEDYTSPPRFQRASTTTYFVSTTHNLDIRTGSTRHSFADGYTHFAFYENSDGSDADSREDRIIFRINPLVVNSSEATPVPLEFAINSTGAHRLHLLARISNTSFKTGRWASDTSLLGQYLTKIVGYKQIIRPSSL